MTRSDIISALRRQARDIRGLAQPRFIFLDRQRAKKPRTIAMSISSLITILSNSASLN
jgi:hypothetical protein